MPIVVTSNYRVRVIGRARVKVRVRVRVRVRIRVMVSSNVMPIDLTPLIRKNTLDSGQGWD